MNNGTSEIQSIIHDANNLLNNIIKCAERASDNNISADELKQHLGLIKNNSFKVAEMLESLNRRPSKHSFDSIDLPALIEEISAALAAAESKKIAVDYSFAHGLFAVIGNKLILERIFLNVLKNAFEALTDGGKIHISAVNTQVRPESSPYRRLKSGNYVLIKIADNGPGLNDYEKSKIFNLGYSTKIGSSLRGTGLFGVKQSLLESGGWIDADSSTNDGAVFSIYLPSAVSTWTDCDYSPNILLAEDDPVLLELLHDELINLGLTVTAVSDGKHAIEQIENDGKFSLFIFDQNLPEFSGVECAQKTFEDFPDKPVILISGSIEELSSDESNIRFSIKKPFETEHLINVIGHLIPPQTE